MLHGVAIPSSATPMTAAALAALAAQKKAAAPLAGQAVHKKGNKVTYRLS